jgi:hemerythrin
MVNTYHDVFGPNTLNQVAAYARENENYSCEVRTNSCRSTQPFPALIDAEISRRFFMPQTIWSPEMETGLDAMDDLHREFCEALAGQSSLPDDVFCNAYPAFIMTIERAFRTEEQWMEEIDFPSLKSHREQHARVLGALHGTQSMVLDGDVMTGRKIVDQLLPEWFMFHASTMNMAVALALQLAGSHDMQPALAAAAYA